MTNRYIDGFYSNDWITWTTTQNVSSPGYFVHSSYYLMGKPAESTEYTIRKIISDKRYQARRNIRNKKLIDKDITWNDISPYFKFKKTHGAPFYVGSHPVIIWQNPLTGQWMMSTGYGISVGIQVSLHNSYEWTLRSRPLIGFIYWLGPGKKAHKDTGGIGEMLTKKEIVLPWDQVYLDVWGIQSESGMELGGVKWLPLSGMKDKMRIGNISVIRDPAPSSVLTREWKSWATEQFRQGKGIIHTTRKNGNKKGDFITVWQYGTESDVITKQDYDRLKSNITLNVIHDNSGRILYIRH